MSICVSVCVCVCCRFVRRLLFFCKPSSKLYSSLELDHPKARQLTVVGCQFVEFLQESEEVRETRAHRLTRYRHTSAHAHTHTHT